MSAELLVNVNPRETRVALIENGVLQEVFVERANRLGLVGNIYKGRVCRVLPGMQAAFVDIGLDRAAFLHASDIADTHAKQVRDAPVSEEGMPAAARTEPAPTIRNGASITDLVRDGQEVLVQVIKDPSAPRGAAHYPGVDSLVLPRLHARRADARSLAAHRGRGRTPEAAGSGAQHRMAPRRSRLQLQPRSCPFLSSGSTPAGGNDPGPYADDERPRLRVRFRPQNRPRPHACPRFQPCRSSARLPGARHSRFHACRRPRRRRH